MKENELFGPPSAESGACGGYAAGWMGGACGYMLGRPDPNGKHYFNFFRCWLKVYTFIGAWLRGALSTFFLGEDSHNMIESCVRDLGVREAAQ